MRYPRAWSAAIRRNRVAGRGGPTRAWLLRSFLGGRLRLGGGRLRRRLRPGGGAGGGRRAEPGPAPVEPLRERRPEILPADLELVPRPPRDLDDAHIVGRTGVAARVRLGFAELSQPRRHRAAAYAGRAASATTPAFRPTVSVGRRDAPA